MTFCSRTIAVAAIVLLAVPALAGSKPTLLGASRDWTAYQAMTSDGKVCYALATPRSTEPKNVNRDPVYLLISDWPDRKVANEVEVVPGYPYKIGEPVVAEVGHSRTPFFTRNDGTDGTAWIQDSADESRLVEQMRKGSEIAVSGVSDRGTHTKDVYSLSGISAALDRIKNACGM